MSEFAGKVALVTGAGAGIGAAVARAFGAAGAQVGVLDRDRQAAEATASAIGDRALVLPADVRVEAEIEAAVGALAGAFGGIDVLANIAGVVRYGEAPDFPEDDWDFVIDVNLKGPFLTARHVVPHLRARGGGAIVNTASVQAFASQRTVAAYSASKGGVVSMTRTLALDHAHEGIRVNAIAPGSVRTPMLQDAAELFGPEDPAGTMEGWGRLHPIGRVIEPAEVAEAVLFLAGPRSSAITGTTLLIDGGLSAGLPL